MTTNIKQYNTVIFTAEFRDAAGNLYLPPLDSVILNIMCVGKDTPVSVSIPMSVWDYYFTAIWTSNAKGPGSWNVTAPNSPGMRGDFRVI